MATGQPDPIERHLAHWVAAYGPDLVPPPGRAQPRPASSAAPAVSPFPSTQPPSARPPSAPPPNRQFPITQSPIAAAAIAPPAAPTRTGPPAPEMPPSPRASPRAAPPPDRAAPPPAGDDGAQGRAGEPPGAAALPPTDAAAALDALREEVLPCTRCRLADSRTTVVFGEGNPRARAMFVGEAPGATEDRTGRPFVGPAGQLLDRILSGAMGLRRSDVFIANINKCRPPGNRAPAPDEVAACLPFLRRQVEIVRPEVIVCLGRTAAQNLLGTAASIGALRGQRLEYAGIPVVVTWHPAYLLREPSRKRETWDDIKRVNRLLGLPEVPGAGA